MPYRACPAALITVLAACHDALGAQAETQPDFLSMTMRMFSVLALILGVLVIAVYLAKKAGIRTRSFFRTKHMEVVDRLYVGPKQSVVLLKVGRQSLLLGVSASTISFLSTVKYMEHDDDRRADGGSAVGCREHHAPDGVTQPQPQGAGSYRQAVQKLIAGGLDSVRRREAIR